MYHIVYVPYLNAELVTPFLVEATYGGCSMQAITFKKLQALSH
jgi:hypothetical protein